MNLRKESSPCHRLRTWATTLWRAEGVYRKMITLQAKRASQHDLQLDLQLASTWHQLAISGLHCAHGRGLEHFGAIELSRCSWMMPLLSLLSRILSAQGLGRSACGGFGTIFAAARRPNMAERCLERCLGRFVSSLSSFNIFNACRILSSTHGKACDILLPMTFLCPVGLANFKVAHIRHSARTACIQWLAGVLDTPGARAIAREMPSSCYMDMEATWTRSLFFEESRVCELNQFNEAGWLANLCVDVD